LGGCWEKLFQEKKKAAQKEMPRRENLLLRLGSAHRKMPKIRAGTDERLPVGKGDLGLSLVEDRAARG